ncbi:hypothetical protein EYC80_000881 [Monilinia laxa]|uniref:Carbohydrate esterase family 16 protein n=1 Tax=Monilinia laxa TaxID=61186 RepID=A0A5N6K7K9_MONLA|nr:hypothetical protein EYC80_000881 [Monilinia laxa]
MVNNFALLALVGSTFASPITSIKSRATTDTKYLFSFGDSYSQTDFDITGTKPSADNPIGNPAFPGDTTDNGVNWIGHLVESHNSSLLLSYNFAFGGAVVDASIVAPYEDTVLTLVNQTAEFVENLSPAPSYAEWTADNSLFALWFGVNDIGNSYWLSNETDIISAIFDSYFAQAQLLYNAGGRNFLFLTCPPVNKSPMMLAYGDSVTSSEATVIAAYNAELSARVAKFNTTNTGVTTHVFDTQVPFNAALNDPKAYGATDATCYNADGTSCLWWNNLHPGQAIQKLIADGVAEQLSGKFFQASSSGSTVGIYSLTVPTTVIASSSSIAAVSTNVPISSTIKSSIVPSSTVSPSTSSISKSAASSSVKTAAAVITPSIASNTFISSSVTSVVTSVASATVSSASSVGDDECEA